MNLGQDSVATVEMWGIWHGLQIAWNRGFRNILVESGSLLVINWILDGCERYHPCDNLRRSILSLPGQDGEVRFNHVLREANQVADKMANFGHNADSDVVIFYFAPPFICLCLDADKAGISFLRGS